MSVSGRAVTGSGVGGQVVRRSTPVGSHLSIPWHETAGLVVCKLAGPHLSAVRRPVVGHVVWSRRHRIRSRVARQVDGRTVVCRTRSSDSPRWQTVRTGRPVRCPVVGHGSHGSRWSRSAVRSIYAIESDGSRTDLTICHGFPFTVSPV